MPDVVRVDLPVDLLSPNPNNPNVMKSREFDLLVDNLQQAGFTDPVLVWPRGNVDAFLSLWDAVRTQQGEDGFRDSFAAMVREAEISFVIVGGHHRTEAAKYLDMDFVPCTVIVDPNFGEEEADSQLLRHNTIHGSLDPERFIKLYDKYKEGHSDDVLQEMFGFSDEAAFKALITTTESTLPPDLKEKFKESRKEIKTIDDLSKILNHLFSTYGDTLKTGYMILDQGGQKSVWLRISKKTLKGVEQIGGACIEAEVTMDQLFGQLVQSIAAGDAADLLKGILEKTPKSKIPQGLAVLPTEDNIEAVQEMKDNE